MASLAHLVLCYDVLSRASCLVVLCFAVFGAHELQEQFMSSSAATTAPTQATATAANDAAPYSDQYAAYSPYPEPGKPSVAHV